MFTLYNVCSVIGGYSVHQGMFSTSGDIIMNVGGNHVYIGGYSVHQRNTISTLEGKDIMSTLGGGGEGYHEYIGGCSAHQRDIMMHLGEQLDKFFHFLLKTPMYS